MTSDDYKGMTVNERLFISGLLEGFDKAVRKKDVNMVISILKQIDIKELSINAILEHVGLIDNKKNNRLNI